MNLESQKVTVKNNASYLFEALCNVNNFEKLMPDSIAKFEVTDAESFIFGLTGMPEIKLRIKDITPNSRIVLGAASDKLPFTLTANIEPISDSSSTIQLVFEGEFNAMMAMMVKGPITKFIETLSENMHKL
jgi:hypothetical protein